MKEGSWRSLRFWRTDRRSIAEGKRVFQLETPIFQPETEETRDHTAHSPPKIELNH